MTIGIIGLGLIGGSLAKALKERSAHRILGRDRQNVTDFALSCGAIDGLLSEENIPGCDVIITALYPDDTVSEITKLAPYLSKDTVVTDCAGIKEKVCGALFPLAREYGFTFIGGHPMAGIELSGFENARPELFRGASLILVPPEDKTARDEAAIEILSSLAREIGFGRVTLSSAPRHDKIIAYTSQLAHVVSSAYIQSPASGEHFGFSAGSFRDLTRVAYLNEAMWCELFLQNKTRLTEELDALIGRLTEYSRAIREEDEAALYTLLHRGKEMKTESERQFSPTK